MLLVGCFVVFIYDYLLFRLLWIQKDKSQIKGISKKNEAKNKPLEHSTKRRSSVTILGSTSYHNQNKDLLILNPFDDCSHDDPDSLTHHQVYTRFFSIFFYQQTDTTYLGLLGKAEQK